MSQISELGLSNFEPDSEKFATHKSVSQKFGTGQKNGFPSEHNLGLGSLKNTRLKGTINRFD